MRQITFRLPSGDSMALDSIGCVLMVALWLHHPLNAESLTQIVNPKGKQYLGQ